ncbi:MAG: formyltransferase family protein [Flavipsychrobacter sp.]
MRTTGLTADGLIHTLVPNMNQQPKIGVLCNSTLGTPSLHALLSNKLVAAVGMPDRVHDATNDIKNIAATFQQEVAVFTKSKLSTQLIDWVKKNGLDVVLVFTFPWKIAADVLTIPPLGFINFHFGLLPEYRGADAIFWTIKDRAPYGGISVHRMDANFDTGGLIHIEKVPLLPTDTYGMHSAKLANANMPVLQKLLPLIFSGQLKTTVQEEQKANYYSKPGVQEIGIKWDKMTAAEIVALVNACNPWNKGAYTMFNNMPLRITEAATQTGAAGDAICGTILEINNDGLLIQCKDKEALLAKVVTIEEGIYTAASFAQYCGIKKGLKFSNL